MVAESLVGSQPTTGSCISSSCIDSKDLVVNDLERSSVSARLDNVQAMSGVMSIDKLVDANGSASSGSKRARDSSEDRQAVVHVRYECLSRYVLFSLCYVFSCLVLWSSWR